MSAGIAMPTLHEKVGVMVRHDAQETPQRCAICKTIGQETHWRLCVRVEGWTYDTEAVICEPCRKKEYGK